ncbi:MAG: hypothetical protein BWY64_02241 [bacterium ADurb.Bin363]|nr:MAG: hypothetical protein BWY64_02241 [bacterium ADurb.Bin363]
MKEMEKLREDETNRVEKISHIIEKRKPLIQKIEKVEKNLKGLISALNNLEINKNRITGYVDDDSKGKLEEISTHHLKTQIQEHLFVLSKLKTRFSRDTINIGVVGRARMGKSRLLQCLSGLSAAEIPDGNRLHCTGVKSTIYHNPYVETYGEVFFHTEQTFLDEVIAPYYRELELGNCPIFIEEFASKSLPDFTEINKGYADPRAKYEHLKKYHSNFDKYRHLLLTSSPLRISKEQIREYVSQHTPDGNKLYNYLAVREVKIFCKFPNTSAGKIALVDMPGLGDTGIGDEERLIKILGRDIDLVLFVRMPKSTGDHFADVDVKLYDTARTSLSKLPIDLWSFMILNRTGRNSENGDNYNNCKDLIDTIGEKHIKVVDAIIADCSHIESVNKDILDKVLDYLVENITGLDCKYADSCQESLKQLQNMIKGELKKCDNALEKVKGKDNEAREFKRLFDIFWRDVTNGLEDLLKKLDEDYYLESSPFKEQLKKAIELSKRDSIIPELNKIEERRNIEGSYENAYNKYLHEIRTKVTEHFLTLDEGLRKTIDSRKVQVIDILIGKGKLANITGSSGLDFLDAFINILPEDLEKLKLGFTILSEFHLSYRGLIHHRIRKHLDPLTPDKTKRKLQEKTAQEIKYNLEALLGTTLYEIESEIEKFLFEPNQAAFGMVEEFLDRVLRAEDVQNEWYFLLEEFKSEIWTSEFSKLGEKSRIRKAWESAIKQVAEYNVLEFDKVL